MIKYFFIMAISLFAMQAMAIEIHGSYRLAQPCDCEDYDKTPCSFVSTNKRDISLFMLPYLNPEHGYRSTEYISENDWPLTIYYSDHSRTSQLKVHPRDVLKFNFDMSGVDLFLTVENLSRPQGIFPIEIKVHEVGKPGPIDKNNLIRATISDSETKFDYSRYEVKRGRNYSAGPPATGVAKYHTSFYSDIWTIEKKRDSVVVTSLTDYRLKNDPSAYDLYPREELLKYQKFSCEFVSLR